MSSLKKEITLVGGIGQMSTTLLGTGLFMVPAIAASLAGQQMLWAWWFLLVTVCPIAITFAMLGSATQTQVEHPILFGRHLAHV